MSEFLVIDDDDDYGLFVVENFRRLGQAAVAVGTVRQALALLATRCYCGLVIDLTMPEMDGLEAVKAVRKLDAEVPILVLSGGFGGDNRPYLTAARLLGADLTGAKADPLQAALAQLIRLGEERCPPPPCRLKAS